MTNPTQAQMQQTTEIAAQTLSAEMNISVLEVLTNHQDILFHMVCAFAAQAAAMLHPNRTRNLKECS